MHPGRFCVNLYVWLVLVSVTSPAQTPPLRTFRSELPASGKLSLPATVEINKIVAGREAIWYLGRDCSSLPCSAAVYSWSEAGITAYRVPSVNSQATETSDLVLMNNSLPLLVRNQGVWELSGEDFQPSRSFGDWKVKAIAGPGPYWAILDDKSVSYLPFLPISGNETKLTLPGTIQAWAVSADGTLWVALTSPDQPASRLYRVTPSSEIQPENVLDSLAIQSITYLFADASNYLWIASGDGRVIRKSGLSFEVFGPENGLPGTLLKSMAEDTSGNYYLLFQEAAGLPSQLYGIASSVRSNAEPQFTRFDVPSLHSAIQAIAVDSQNGAWIAAGLDTTYRMQGLNGIQWPHSPRHPQPDSTAKSEPVRGGPTFVPAAAQQAPAAAIGPFSSGKFAFLGASNGLTSNYVSTIVGDRLGNIYFTTGFTYNWTNEQANVPGNGISRWDHRAYATFTTANTNGALPSNTVHASIYDATNDVIWFGTDQGMARFNPNTTTFTKFLAGINVRDFRIDGSGNLWAATLGSGVYKIRTSDGTTLAQYTTGNTAQLGSNQVSALAIDGSNNLYAGTDGGNVSRLNLNTNVWTNLNLPLAPDSGRVFDLETDASNNLWIALPFQGLMRRTPGGTTALFHAPQVGGGYSGTYRFLTLFRDGSGNLWIASGDFGGLGTPNTAFSFLPASQINAASPAFQNYSVASGYGIPINSVLSFYSESGNAIWFGSPGDGAWRFGGPVDMPGWPQLLTGYTSLSSPVLADLNGDGKLDIIVGDTAGFVYAFNYDGTLLWKYDARNAVVGRTPGSIVIQSSPAVADVDGDGKPEVVVGLGGQALPGIPVGQGGLLILSNTGQLKRILYDFDITDYHRTPGAIQDGYAEGFLASPVLANVDDDPEPEIMVGAFDNFFYAFNADGSPVYSRDNDGDGKFDEDGPGDWTPYTPFDFTDDFPGWKGEDDDGNGEIDEGNAGDNDEDGLIGEDPPEWPFSAGDTTVSSAVVGDILRNGTPAIIFGTDHLGNLTPSDPRGGILNVLTPQATQLPGFPKTPAQFQQVIWSSPVLVDLDGDGYWEIIHGSGNDLTNAPNNLIGQLVYAWKRDGASFLPGANGVFATTQGRSFASFAVGDINNDGQPELIIATTSLRDVNGNLIDANGNPTSPANAVGQLVYAFNHDGSLVPGFPVRPYTISPGADLVGSPILADVNGDGFLDIIVPVGPGIIVLDHNGRAIPGMGLFENLQDTTYAGEITSTAAIADIDGDGILELVYTMGTGSGSGGILHVMKLGPVNSTVQRSWPMFRRIPSHNAIFDVLVGDAQALDNGSNLVVTAQAFAGRNPITSVVADLSALGGSSSQALNDAGTGGDHVANDGYFTFQMGSTGFAAGRYQIPITVSDGVHTDTKTIFYLHSGTGKLLSVSKSSIDFGTVGQGLDKEMHFSVANVGNQNVTIGGMTNSNPEFTVAIPGPSESRIYPNSPPSGFPQVLAPGQTLIVRLRLHPGINNALGPRSSTLTIQSDEGTNPNRTLSLTGAGQALSGGIQYQASTVNFIPTAVGSSYDFFYTIKSVGVDPLIIKSITTSDPAFVIYKLTNPPAPRKFEVGVTAPYVLRFKPIQTGTVRGTLTITTNDPANPTVVVSLNGTGTTGSGGCPITWAPTSVQVGSAGGSGLTIAVSTNTGCTWTAVSNAPWIHLVSGANGSGSGTITYNADPNTTPLYQNGTISLAGQTITVTQAPPVATNTEAFVRQLYLDILSRTADPAGLSAWVGWINTGVYTRAQVASQFFQSQEFYGTGNYITKLYLGIMLRDPDYGGWTGWFNYLHNGYTQTDILNAFLASPEFQSRYGSLDNTAFVTLLYNNMLNRPPDQAGLQQWVTWLNNGTYTRAQVANSFITSQEFQLREGNRVYANMLYIGFLRRAGDPNGLDGWTNWLTNGTYTLDQEVNGFITSPEYLARF